MTKMSDLGFDLTMEPWEHDWGKAEHDYAEREAVWLTDVKPDSTAWNAGLRNGMKLVKVNSEVVKGMRLMKIHGEVVETRDDVRRHIIAAPNFFKVEVIQPREKPGVWGDNVVKGIIKAAGGQKPEEDDKGAVVAFAEAVRLGDNDLAEALLKRCGVPANLMYTRVLKSPVYALQSCDREAIVRSMQDSRAHGKFLDIKPPDSDDGDGGDGCCVMQ